MLFRSRAGARRALEFVKAWYPGLDLDRLATLRSEAQPELAATEDALVKHAAAIAEYTDTSIFVPERSEDGEEVPPEWFGMNPDYGEDSAEVIGSSIEEEDKAEDEGEAEAPEDGADGQPQSDRASSNEPRATDPTTARGDQAETSWPTAPTIDAGASSDPPDSVCRLLSCRCVFCFVCFSSLLKNLLIRTIPPVGCISKFVECRPMGLYLCKYLIAINACFADF